MGFNVLRIMLLCFQFPSLHRQHAFVCDVGLSGTVIMIFLLVSVVLQLNSIHAAAVAGLICRDLSYFLVYNILRVTLIHC